MLPAQPLFVRSFAPGLVVLETGLGPVRQTQKNPLLLPWWLKVDRRFDSPIYLFGCEEHFRIRSHCPG